MRHKKIIVGLIITITILCSCTTYIFWDGYYLSNKPCRPTPYPEPSKLKPVEKQLVTYMTENSVEKVLEYYDQQLNAIILQGPDDTDNWSRDRWVRLSLSNNSFVYQCNALDMNRLTKEQGCIYIDQDSSKTRIRTNFYRYTVLVTS